MTPTLAATLNGALACTLLLFGVVAVVVAGMIAAAHVAEHWWQKRADRLMRRGFKAAQRLGYVNRYREDKR